MVTRDDFAVYSGETPKEDLTQLTAQQVAAIDRALAAVGPFGEVRIVKTKGRVRFIETLKSRDLLDAGPAGVEG